MYSPDRTFVTNDSSLVSKVVATSHEQIPIFSLVNHHERNNACFTFLLINLLLKYKIVTNNTTVSP